MDYNEPHIDKCKFYVTLCLSSTKESMSIAPKKPVNYLNNKDILKEIHSSKNTYCYYEKPEYNVYDLIIDYSEPITDLGSSLRYACKPETIEQARLTRAEREGVDPSTIKRTDIVYRIMTWDHIPVAPKQQQKKAVKTRSAREIIELEDSGELDEPNILAEIEAELDDPELLKEMGMDDMIHIRVNFPPFQHYKFDENDNLVCVGLSHWKDGQFSKDHGQITNKLAKMYLMLCDKYAMRFNWRGYSYVDEMRGAAVLQLTYVGLRFNESKSSNPFAYYTAAINNSFRRVLNMEKRNQTIRDDILQMNNLQPSWTRQNDGHDE